MENKKEIKTIVLNREQLLAKEEVQIEEVDLGGGMVVYVRGMYGRERDNFEQSVLKKITKGKDVTYEPSMQDFRAKLVVNTLCDSEGNLILKPGDFEVLSTNMSAARLEKIVNVAQGLSKISEEDKEGLLKNSEDGQAVSSSLDSAEN